MNHILEQVKFDANGLIPAIVQDYASAEVLMMAWMNREALEKTLEEKRACYWSRSRGKLWVKGETSGHVQVVRCMRIDCDGDTLLLQVDQTAGACHTGYRSCFYRRAENKHWVEDGVKVFDSSAVYKK
ncbi:MAG: phosphoribosyl-AMP cyclohydrolase [bacterium]|nr:phosphoribosyl-AMP cyclohydrolase [Candidatus Sumerlaeota bacterium]